MMGASFGLILARRRSEQIKVFNGRRSQINGQLKSISATPILEDNASIFRIPNTKPFGRPTFPREGLTLP